MIRLIADSIRFSRVLACVLIAYCFGSISLLGHMDANFNQKGMTAGIVKINQTRSEMNDGQTTWTILGATADDGEPHLRPIDWSVGKLPYQILTVIEPISNTSILPYADPVPNTSLTGTLRIVAAKGEIEPASFVIRSGNWELQNVQIIPLQLTRENAQGQIPADSIDVRVVKNWYQASDSINRQHGQGKQLVSELLLHDPNLVRVDYANQTNLIRDIAHVEDADRLVPFTIPHRTNQQIWVTSHIPGNCPPGKYSGDLQVSFESNEQRYSTSIKLIVTVLPFTLQPSPIEYSLYYLAWPNLGKPTLDARSKTANQMLADFKDMYAHGLTNVALDHNYVTDPSFNDLAQTLRHMRTAGFNTNTLMYVDWRMTGADNAGLYSGKIRLLRNLALRNGFAELFVYNLDEKDAATLLRNRQSFDVVHANGGKNFVAFNSSDLGSLRGLLDMAVVPRGQLKTVELAKKVGIAPWAYSDPQAGEEKPYTYRDRYGFALWVDGYDGACNYAYQTGSLGWDDWGDPKWRPHNMTYPTISKPIPTLQWEGFREAIDDVRYAATIVASRSNMASGQRFMGRKDLLTTAIGAYLPTTPSELRSKIIEVLVGNHVEDESAPLAPSIIGVH